MLNKSVPVFPVPVFPVPVFPRFFRFFTVPVFHSSLPNGASTLVTTATNQAVYGFEGDDRIELNHVATRGYSGIGMDALIASEDDQHLYGEDGKGILRAGAGAQDLFGGAGDDAAHVRDGKQNESDLWINAKWRAAA